MRSDIPRPPQKTNNYEVQEWVNRLPDPLLPTSCNTESYRCEKEKGHPRFGHQRDNPNNPF